MRFRSILYIFFYLFFGLFIATLVIHHDFLRLLHRLFDVIKNILLSLFNSLFVDNTDRINQK